MVDGHRGPGSAHRTLPGPRQAKGAGHSLLPTSSDGSHHQVGFAAEQSHWYDGWEFAVAFFFVMILVYGAALSHTYADFNFFIDGKWALPRADDELWEEQHRRYAQDAWQARQHGPAFDIVFYGDSILEAWRGTARGSADEYFEGVPAVFARQYGKYRSYVFAMSGDQTGHLMWRLQHGESPKGLHPKAIVLLIGTNDLAAASLEGDGAILFAANGTAQHTKAIAAKLAADAPDAGLILLALLPRGLWGEDKRHRYTYPNKFTEAIHAVNAQLQEVASNAVQAEYVDCGAPFTGKNGKGIKGELMPDALHPNAKGMDALALCLKPAVDMLITR